MSLPLESPVFKLFPPELFDDEGHFLDDSDDSEANPGLAGHDDLAWYDYLARDMDSFGPQYGGAL